MHNHSSNITGFIARSFCIFLCLCFLSACATKQKSYLPYKAKEQLAEHPSHFPDAIYIQDKFKTGLVIEAEPASRIFYRTVQDSRNIQNPEDPTNANNTIAESFTRLGTSEILPIPKNAKFDESKNIKPEFSSYFLKKGHSILRADHRLQGGNLNGDNIIYSPAGTGKGYPFRVVVSTPKSLGTKDLNRHIRTAPPNFSDGPRLRGFFFWSESNESAVYANVVSVMQKNYCKGASIEPNTDIVALNEEQSRELLKNPNLEKDRLAFFRNAENFDLQRPISGKPVPSVSVDKRLNIWVLNLRCNRWRMNLTN